MAKATLHVSCSFKGNTMCMHAAANSWPHSVAKVGAMPHSCHYQDALTQVITPMLCWTQFTLGCLLAYAADYALDIFDRWEFYT